MDCHANSDMSACTNSNLAKQVSACAISTLWYADIFTQITAASNLIKSQLYRSRNLNDNTERL